MGIGKLFSPVNGRGGERQNRQQGEDDNPRTIGDINTIGDIRGEGSDGEAEISTDSGQPLSIAEVVAELVYADKTLKEIAGLDDTQLRWIFFRRRNKYGGLIRQDDALPPGVEVDEEGMRVLTRPGVPFEAMYRSVGKLRGLEAEAIDKSWAAYKAANPRLGAGGE